MSGSNSSAPGSAPDSAQAVSFAVHSMPALAPAPQTRHGRWHMLWLLLVCAAPVVASYFTYYVIRPDGRTNYSELIEPQRPMPGGLALVSMAGGAVEPSSLQGQWLLVVVADGACNGQCEKYLHLQRQLRETLGREKYRLDKIWLVSDGQSPRPEVLQAVTQHGAEATVLQVPHAELLQWLEPAPGRAVQDHFYLIDPMGHWMMRAPPNPDPAKLKRDIEKLLRGSAFWDRPGR